MLEQKDIEINGKSFVIKKFPAVAGREIVTQYPLSATPKLGDYQTNKEIMLKIMCYVGIRIHGTNNIQWLTTEDLVNNHIPDWEMLMKIEWEVMQYNCSFLQPGNLSAILESATEKLPGWITKILTPLSDSLSVKEKPVLKNSKKTTV
jgi:hypothetical protein